MQYRVLADKIYRATSPVIGYSLVAVTSQHQVISIELTLHPDHAETQSTALTSTPAPAPPKSPTSFFQASRSSSYTPQRDPIKDKVYISLLEHEPFDIPKFSSRRAAASLPLVAQATGISQAVITPDALRSLGSRVEAMCTDIREATRGVNAVQARISLQHREMRRRLLKLICRIKSKPILPKMPTPGRPGY